MRAHAAKKRAALLLLSTAASLGSAAKPRCRLFVESRIAQGARVQLSDAQQHYLLSVMRVRDREPVLLFDGISGEWLATVDHTGRRTCASTPLEQTRPQDGPTLAVSLHFALLKPKRLALLVEKATELGVHALQPLVTARTVVREVSLDKLRATAVEAAEQCGRLSVPLVLPPLTGVEACLHSARGAVGSHVFACDERPECTIRLDDALAAAAASGPLRAAAFVVGPEGGFAPDEFALLRGGAQLVSLGPNVLRSETAALSALSIMHMRM